MGLGAVDEGDERGAVVVDREVAQIEVPVGLVVAVGLAREIVGPDGHAAVGEARARRGVEELAGDGVAVGGGQDAEGGPTELIKAGAEALHAMRGTGGPGQVVIAYVEVEHVPVEGGLKCMALPPGSGFGGLDQRDTRVKERFEIRHCLSGQSYGPGDGRGPGQSAAAKNLSAGPCA